MKMKVLGVGLVALALAACSSNSGLSPDGGPSGGAGTHAGSGTAGAAGTTGAAGTAGAAGTTSAAGTTGVGPGGQGGAIGGAGTTGDGGPAGGPASRLILSFPAAPSRNLDVLFMIDNSSSMTVFQSGLNAVFSSYTDTLKALPGGLPNVHIGVVSSSLGAGRNPSIAQCPPGGDLGILQSKPLGPTCATASLNAGNGFISDAGGMANYTGDIADVFGCIAELGSSGCGFEHQLASVMRALGADGAPAPPQNAGFLRPDALLQIVLFTNEDDCSAPPDSDLFDSSSSMVSDPLGPLQSYRCNEFGHLCGGKPPPRQPMGEVDLSGMCVSAEDGRLLRIQDVTTALKRLKNDPSKVFVSVITGPKDPYLVNLGAAPIKTDPNMWPYVQHSCMTNLPSGSVIYADPAVRLWQLTQAFGNNGILENICTTSYAPALKRIAAQVGNVFAPCLPADPRTCTFDDDVLNAAGFTDSQPVPPCKDASDPGPCWATAASPTCQGGQTVVFRRPAATNARVLSTTATCP
jgi:hypothetical protein